MAFLAIAAFVLASHAQTVNWNLVTAGQDRPGDGSGTLTLTDGIITGLTGTVGGNSIALLSPGSFAGNDNALPITGGGLAFVVSNYGDVIFFDLGGDIYWSSDAGGGQSGQATFTYDPVPEPSTWATGAVFGAGALLTSAARRRRRTQQA